jgi:hypothetical protein
MSSADAIRDRQEAKRPKPEPKESKRGRKAVEGNEEGQAAVPEPAETAEEEVNEPAQGS